MDEKTAGRVKEEVERIADDEEIELDQLVVFGSRVRDDFTEDSDVDLILVSRDFDGTNWYQRPKQFYLKWDYEELPSPELLCYTPEEFNEKKERAGNIVRTAVKEGVKLA